MSVFKVASRYAKSLLDLVNENGKLEQSKADIELIAEVIRSNSELKAVLSNPIVKIDKKQNILKSLFAGKVGDEVLSFLDIMVRKGRGELVYATTLEFIREYDELKGIVHAEVVSASPLSATNMESLKANIAAQINAQVVLTNTIDESLIGGFVVTVGDRQIDASIAGRLDNLERHFTVQGV